MEPMHPRIDEVADDIYRISTWIPEVTPQGFTFNQFLVLADEPLLYHTGPRAMFPLVAEAVARITPVASLRWISFGHVESDECGSMNMWLASAPDSEVIFGALGCEVSLYDLCDRPPRPLADGEVLDLGGKRVRQIPTPHIPHGWEAQVLFEETTRTLLLGDLLSQGGNHDPFAASELVGAALEMENAFGVSSLHPRTGDVIRSLGDLDPATLAIMHGASLRGDGRRALHDLASGYDDLITRG
jgi:flavorubredoxin